MRGYCKTPRGVAYNGKVPLRLKGLYAIIDGHVNNDGEAFPSLGRLVEYTGAADRKTVQRWIQELEDLGLLEVTREHGKVNRYRLTGVNTDSSVTTDSRDSTDSQQESTRTPTRVSTDSSQESTRTPERNKERTNKRTKERKRVSNPSPALPLQDPPPGQDQDQDHPLVTYLLTHSELGRRGITPTYVRARRSVEAWVDDYGEGVDDEVKRAMGWLVDNPKNRKKDVLRFIGNWLRNNKARQNGHAPKLNRAEQERADVEARLAQQKAEAERRRA